MLPDNSRAAAATSSALPDASFASRATASLSCSAVTAMPLVWEASALTDTELVITVLTAVCMDVSNRAPIVVNVAARCLASFAWIASL